MNNLKICLVGPGKFYPAYDSLLLILKKILWSGQVTEIRTKSWMMTKVPSILKPLLYLLQDLMLYLKILTYYKKLRLNVILIYQGYYPLTCIGLSIVNLKLLLYIGHLVSTYDAGYEVDFNDVEDICSILRYLYANRDELAKKSVKARLLATQIFSLEAMQKALISLVKMNDK